MALQVSEVAIFSFPVSRAFVLYNVFVLKEAISQRLEFGESNTSVMQWRKEVKIKRK